MKKYKFKAEIEAGDGGGRGVFFPYDTQKELGTRGKFSVKANIHGVAYAGSLIQCGSPRQMLPILKAIRAQIGKGPGDTIAVVVWKDEESKILEVPAHTEKLLRDEGLLPFFAKLSHTHRKEYCRWISEAKQEEPGSAAW